MSKFLEMCLRDRLVLRVKETYDGTLPSGNAAAARLLVALARLTHKPEWEAQAMQQLEFLSADAAKFPAGHCYYCLALLDWAAPEVVSTHADAAGVAALVRGRDIFGVHLPPTGRDALREVFAMAGDYLPRPAYYVCREGTCLPPVETARQALELLEAASR